jgi:acyl carrier protein
MNIEVIKTQVIGILEDLCTEKITDTSLDLVGDLALDSLRMVMLLVMIEDVFEIELDESDMNPFKLRTVNDVINLVSKYKIESEG